MKLNKIFAIALAALSMTACSDDDSDCNTAAGVSVQMKEMTMEISEDMESGKYYTVPVAVLGEANGPIVVKFEVQGTSESPAIEDEHYIITSKTLVIPAGTHESGIEFYPVGDDIQNDDRQFIVTITSVEGATLGAQNTCVVTLKDNESLLPNAYANMQGAWTFKASDDGEDVSFTVNCIGFPESNENYLRYLVFTGWLGDPEAMAVAAFSFDAATNQAIISFPLGQWIREDVNFQGLGVGDVLLASVAYTSQGASLVASGSISATVSEDYKSIQFSESAELIGAIFIGGNFTGYTNFWWDTMSMSR